jgi:hypothetical protein
MPIPLELPPDLPVTYANVVRIGHSPAELVFDYAQLLGGMANARVLVRIVMSPIGAKMLHRALTENLARYEASFGEIQLPGGGSHLAQDLFRSIQPPDSPKPPDVPPKPPADGGESS